MIKKQVFSGPIIYAPVGALCALPTSKLASKPGSVIEYTMPPGHFPMIYNREYEWNDAIFWSLLELGFDSDD